MTSRWPSQELDNETTAWAESAAELGGLLRQLPQQQRSRPAGTSEGVRPVAAGVRILVQRALAKS